MPGSADSAFLVEDRELREAVPARGIPEGFDSAPLLRRRSKTHAEFPIAG